MRRTHFLVVACCGFASGGVKADEYVFTPPTADRWQYGFNSTPGSRTIGSTFTAPGWAAINGQFNDRDGIVLLEWDTAALIPPGAPPASYNVAAVELTVTNIPGALWEADYTVDPWHSFDLNGDGVVNGDGFPRGHANDLDGESSDPDPGRTIDLYGVGFGPTYTPDTWTETSPFVGSMFSGPPYFGDPVAPRDPFPFVFQEGTGEMLHVEDHLRGLHNDHLPVPVEEFDPQSWAFGHPVNYTPGSQPVPFDIEFSVDLSLSGGRVRQYFQEQLAAGKVYLMISAAHESSQGATQDGYPAIYMREAVDPGAKPAVLRIVLADRPGDFDGDGDVDIVDYAGLAGCLTGPGGTIAGEGCEVFDFDGSTSLDLADFAAFQREFGS